MYDGVFPIGKTKTKIPTDNNHTREQPASLGIENHLDLIARADEKYQEATLYAMTNDRLDEFKLAYETDAEFKRTFEGAELELNEKPDNRFVKSLDGLLWFRDANQALRLCLPRGQLRNEVLRLTHESPIETAHAGGHKLLLRLRLKYWWPKMRQDVLDFAEGCDVCQKIKPDKRKKSGLLHPLAVPERPYHTVTMDLITGLPLSDGFEAILVFTDKLTKHVQFIPSYNSLDKLGFARLFVEHVVCRFGLPEVIVCDRDGRWMSDF